VDAATVGIERKDSLMRPLILSGGPAVGKTTCARALAAERQRAAFIDADDIRQLVVAGDVTLWSGAEGRAQHALAARNVSALGRNLLADGFAVTVADIVTSETLPLYRAGLPDCFIVHLAIARDAAYERAASRQVYLTADEFDLLHEMTSVPPAVDLVLDVTGMSADQQLDRLRDAWEGAERSVP
jgi:predicted kinase